MIETMTAVKGIERTMIATIAAKDLAQEALMYVTVLSTMAEVSLTMNSAGIETMIGTEIGIVTEEEIVQ